MQALVETNLDILARSLRRPTFGRVLSALMLVQTGILLVWYAALASCIHPHSTRPFWLVLVLIAGKWAVGTCARLATYLASGGVASWFDEQWHLLQQLSPEPDHGALPTSVSPSPAGTVGDVDVMDDRNRMPEAYRTVNASVYQSVLDLDDDDAEDEEEDDDDDALEYGSPTRDQHPRDYTAPSSSNHHPSSSQRMTVKSLLMNGVTVSFGSVAQCGLVGGIAQYIYSQLRKYQAAHAFFRPTTTRDSSSAPSSSQPQRTRNGFRSMNVVTSTNGSSRSSRSLSFCSHVGVSVLGLARGFVRRYSDLAMCHVALYYKSYQKAARDVAVLVEESGACFDGDSRFC